MSRTVAVVGSGVSAALIARGLLEKYPSIERITLLEAGNAVEQMNLRKWQDYVTTGVLPYAPNRDAPQDYESTPDRIELEKSRLFVRGGSTVHWSGWALRFKPEDFMLHSAAGREIDWPYGYDTLEPYYHLAEHALGIAGDSTDDDPPRKGRRYRYEAPAFTQMDGLVIEGLKSHAIDFGHLPVARFADRCVTTGTCKYCPVGARFSATMVLDELTHAHAASGRFSLRLGCPVRSVLMRDGKTAIGVEYTELATGETRTLAADLVILCAGAIETPKILLASRHPAWPDGLGNRSGHVGRHLKTHPMLYVNASLPSNPRRMHQELDFPTLCSRHFDREAYQRDGKFFFVREASSPSPGGIEKMMMAGKSTAFIDAATRGRMSLTLNGLIEQFSQDGNLVEAAPGTTRFGVPRTRIRYAQPAGQEAAARGHIESLKTILRSIGGRIESSGVQATRGDHTASTTRMSASDLQGVVDANLKIHGTDNVYVCSNAVFPSVAAVNPTLTLAAVALRFVDVVGADIAPAGSAARVSLKTDG